MIEIDRSSGISIHRQVVTAIRFRIANGTFRVGDMLPPTRRLASQLGISFHTVRKAYLELAEDGLVSVLKGSGFIVLDVDPPDKSRRMDRGASVIASALEELVGFGLDESEIEYLVDEQISLLSEEAQQVKIVVATPYRELGQCCALHISNTFQRDCISCGLEEAVDHLDADILAVPFRHVKRILSSNPKSDVVGVAYEMNEDAIATISRLLDHETLGLVTRYSDAVAPLSSEIRNLTKFSGHILAVSVEEGDSYLASLMRQSELVIYTPGAERVIKPFLERVRKHEKLDMNLANSSIERLRSLVP